MSSFISLLTNIFHRHWKLIGVLIIALLILNAGRSFFKSTSPRDFQTTQIERGDLQINISATGTLEPEEVIDVGAQIAGQIRSFGSDKNGKPIDYRSEVEEGMVLAQIDDIIYASDLVEAQAQLKRAKADVLQMQAKLHQAERDWARAQKLGPSDALSQSSYDNYQALFETSRANVAVAESSVTQAEAAVARAERNLSYCTIRSPVKGVVIDRRVNIGQTVVASLNAPSLFLIAKDLTKMQVWVSVNEADIGKIIAGQKVNFTVDAFPNDRFSGEVRKVRLNASLNQNVVNYIVEVATDNSSGKLLPYLTANVRFDVAGLKDVWLVPNAALRLKASALKGKAAGANRSNSGAGTREERESLPAGKGQIWVLRDDEPQPLTVEVGETDGVKTAINSPELQEGMTLVVGVREPEKKAGQTNSVNPFAPTMPRSGGRRGT